MMLSVNCYPLWINIYFFFKKKNPTVSVKTHSQLVPYLFNACMGNVGAWGQASCPVMPGIADAETAFLAAQSSRFCGGR